MTGDSVKAMKTNTITKEDSNQYSLPSETDLTLRSYENIFDYELSNSLHNTTASITGNNVIRVEPLSHRSLIKEKELAWWLGKVIEIRVDSFTALLEDLAGKKSNVEFERETIDPNELDLLFPGAKFTYAISQIDKPSGREYVTRLAFSTRRTWLEEYAQKAEELADEIFPEDLLNLE